MKWRCSISVLLIVSVFSTGCAPQLYTDAELKSDGKLESELIHKKVEVWKHDNQRIE